MAAKVTECKAPIRAAEYVRKSTDHQKYSTENQSEANRLYAELHGMESIRRYVDEGKSGLTFERRRSLQRLINDVQSGAADFKVILVYDVSRWGRPQDPDEAAYYEFICKRAGIAVHYCAEPFENDGSALATLSKNMKRWMAGEFSRDLSVKVFAGQSRLVRLGYGPITTVKRYSSNELLKMLRKCLRENGRFSARLLTRAKGFPAATTYQFRFGSLKRAYRKVGYKV
jgi:DNA invertase Pin-like site-specific DNA recombinase